MQRGLLYYVEIGCRSVLKGILEFSGTSLSGGLNCPIYKVLIVIFTSAWIITLLTFFHVENCCMVGFRHDSGVECCKLLFFQKIIGIVEEALSLLLTQGCRSDFAARIFQNMGKLVLSLKVVLWTEILTGIAFDNK